MTTIEALSLISMIATPATILSAVAVVYVWHRAAWNAVFKPSGPLTDRDWFVIGVAVGFIGQLFDNTFWGLSWHAHFLELPHRDAMFEAGPAVNLFFRQIPGIIAALCHVKAAVQTESAFLRRVIAACWASGLVYASIFFWAS